MDHPAFIDCHTHILPGVDDGAINMAESLLILKEAVDVGVREIILTPHFPYCGTNLDKISQEFTSLRDAAEQSRLAIKLHLGCELMLSFDIPELIATDKRLTINGCGRYALIEVPTFEMPVYTSDVFFSLLTRGVTPIFAHPERCLDVVRDYRQVGDFINNGVMIQIDAGSLLGKYGRKVRSTAISLVKAGLCHIVSSDVHRSGVINRLLPEALSYLEKTIGKAKTMELVYSNPAKLIKQLNTL